MKRVTHLLNLVYLLGEAHRMNTRMDYTERNIFFRGFDRRFRYVDCVYKCTTNLLLRKDSCQFCEAYRHRVVKQKFH